MSEFSLYLVCSQRRRQQLYTRLPIRLELTPQPNGYTQTQLDMRRKAEILMYNGNKTNTKTNRFTKAERWVQIVNGKTVNNVQPTTSTLICPNPDLIPTPTSSSDVPGPIINLMRDTSVPLYRYSTNTLAYSIRQTVDTNMWNVIAQNDLFCPANKQTKLFSIYILDNIDKSNYTFTYTTPFALYTTGTNLKSIQNQGLSNIHFTISAITASIQYGTSVINNSVVTPHDVDVSYNIRSVNNAFTFYSYGGFLSVSNINLVTNPGFIYDVYITLSMTDITNGNSLYQDYYQTLQNGIFCNLSQPYIKPLFNTITSSTISSSSAYNNYNLIGV